ERRLRFAESVHKLATAHWVQTPYRYFPIEPHFLAPGMQYLPVAARANMAQFWPLAIWRPRSHEEALKRILNIELIDRTQMRYYSPTPPLPSEKVFGTTNSLLASPSGSPATADRHTRPGAGPAGAVAQAARVRTA